MQVDLYNDMYLTSGANFKIDLSTAKRKYFGCFNNIKSVIAVSYTHLTLPTTPYV